MEAPPPEKAAATGAVAHAGALPPKARSPPTLTMVMEAVKTLNERKGVSAVAIKRYILHTYPSVDPIRLKYYLKGALAKGLEKGQLIRPPNSSAQGATGRFKLAENKPKQGKDKDKREGEVVPQPEKKKKKKKTAAKTAAEEGKKKPKAKVSAEKVKKPKAKLMAEKKPRSRGAEGEKKKPPIEGPKRDAGKDTAPALPVKPPGAPARGKVAENPKGPQAKGAFKAGAEGTMQEAAKGREPSKPKAGTGGKAKGAPAATKQAKAEGKPAGAAKPEPKKAGAKGKRAPAKAEGGRAAKPQAMKGPSKAKAPKTGAGPDGE